jgi:hypothetical protein
MEIAGFGFETKGPKTAISPKPVMGFPSGMLAAAFT